nr:META domain-containing protein [Rhabdothermincola salaria]
MLALLAVTAAACGDDSGDGSATEPPREADASAPIGNFVLESYRGPDGTVPAVEGSEAVLVLAPDSFNADTGCNVLNGTVDATDPPAITFEPGQMTLRGCVDPAVTAQEQALVDGLARVTDFELEGETFTLLDEAGDVLFTFVAGLAGLEGTGWTVTGVNTGNALEGTDLTGALSLEFAADGTVSGNGGCNSFSGSFTTDGDTIAISDIATTMMACEPDVATLEQQYTAALETATTFELAGTTLTLRDDEGAMQVTLTLASES